MKTARSLSWVVAIAGLWEFLAPFLLGYSAVKSAMWDAVIFGLAILVLGVWAAVSNMEGTVKTLDWINAILGLWLIIAPFFLAYSATAVAMWNDIIIGVVVLVLAAWAALVVGGRSTGQPTGQGHAA